MFTPRSYAVHAPALSLPEAAMLPALEQARIPRNLILPDLRSYHPMPVSPKEQPVDQHARGSMAGRAVLTYIKNASTSRSKR